jgi:hypothetical protein
VRTAREETEALLEKNKRGSFFKGPSRENFPAGRLKTKPLAPKRLTMALPSDARRKRRGVFFAMESRAKAGETEA